MGGARGSRCRVVYNGGMETKELTVDTARRRLVDLTDAVVAFCGPLGTESAAVANGLRA